MNGEGYEDKTAEQAVRHATEAHRQKCIDAAYTLLNRPKRIEHLILRKKSQIAALESCLLPQAIRYDMDKVQSSPEDMLSRIAAEVRDLEQEVIGLQLKKAKAIGEITRAIEQLEDERERTVLTLRYVWGMPAFKVAKAIHYTQRTELRIKTCGVFHLGEKLSHMSDSHVVK